MSDFKEFLAVFYPNLFNKPATLEEKERNYQQGLISTEQKLEILEIQAYVKTRADKDITQELVLMEYLLKVQKYKNQLTQKSNEGLGDFIYAVSRLAVIFGSSFVLWQGLLVPTNQACVQNKAKSTYCEQVRSIDEYFTGK